MIPLVVKEGNYLVALEKVTKPVNESFGYLNKTRVRIPLGPHGISRILIDPRFFIKLTKSNQKMEAVIILLVCIVLPVVIMVIGIKKSKKERIEERDEMFYEGDVKFGENADGTPIEINDTPAPIDAVEEVTKILTDEVEKITKPKKKKPGRKKKSEFPIEPVAPKPKSKRGRKPKNKDKKGGDQMLLS